MTNQQDKAALFHALHRTPPVLVLPNAWDVASARIVEAAGASAVATTSAGVAWGLGAPDGNKLARADAVALIARITAAVEVPVSADIESGFAPDADGVAETVRQVLEAGAVGINLEDSPGHGEEPLLPPAEYAERVAAARAAADTAGIRLYINARTDVYLRGVGEPGSRVQHVIDRAEAYLAAGADGIFVPGATDPQVLATLVKEIGAPVNVLAWPGVPTVSELGELGVARVSVGSGITQAAYALVRRAATEVLSTGTYDSMADSLDFGELQALLAR
jgi:2-methylisocitrate lyase-like PEP mutase family enzyme